MSDNIGKHGILTNEAGVSIPGTVKGQGPSWLTFRIDGASEVNTLSPTEWTFTPDVVKQTRAEWIKDLPIGTVFGYKADPAYVHVKVSDEYTVQVGRGGTNGVLNLANFKINDGNWGYGALFDVGLEVRSEPPQD